MAARLLLFILGFQTCLSIAAAEPIEDNSFLVEEAYNQEAGVVQFIQVLEKDKKGQNWNYLFVNEIPVPDQRHQFSYEIPVLHLDANNKTEVGDLKLNYRHEFVREGSIVATGRVSTTLATGDDKKGFGNGAPGAEASLITSLTVVPRWVQHWNIGAGTTPGAKDPLGNKADINRYFWGLSNVFLITDRLNFMLEMVGGLEQHVTGPNTAAWESTMRISPSLRYGIDWHEWQFVPGVAMPIGRGPGAGDNQFLAYLSIEGKVW